MSIGIFGAPQSGLIYTGSSLAAAQRNYANAQRTAYERQAIDNLFGMNGMLNRHPPMPPTEADLAEQKRRKQQQTWERRVNRIIEKESLRRWRRVVRVAWAIGWVWGGMIAVAITSGMFDLLVRLTLG